MAFNGLQIIRLTFPLPGRNCMAKKQITALIVDFNTRWSIFPENRILERSGSPGINTYLSVFAALGEISTACVNLKQPTSSIAKQNAPVPPNGSKTRKGASLPKNFFIPFTFWMCCFVHMRQTAKSRQHIGRLLPQDSTFSEGKRYLT